MRVVADSHALVWYLSETDASRLSAPALTALASAKTDEGIAVSVATLIDLWYVTQTTGAVSPERLTAIIELLADPTSPLDAIPSDTSVAAAFATIPLSLLRDPWDRLLTATARPLGVPLVTKDSRITAAGLVEVIW